MSIIKAFKNLCYNLYSFFAGLFFRRSKKNVIIGSWGGRNFSDNSRFLYQYLFENKHAFGLNNVVWATRDENIHDELVKNGYSCCLIGTKESKRYHLTSKVHIICNMYSNTLSFEPDIDTKYSCGARKIQLWHGVGIKACGNLSNQAKKKNSVLRNFFRKYLSFLFSEGLWKRCFFVATSEENKRIAIFDYGFSSKKVLIGIYPRLCSKANLLGKEKEILAAIEQKKRTNKIILYLPTFRKNMQSFISPEMIKGFGEWISKNNYIWICKNHAANSKLCSLHSSPNTICLPDDFDVNIIYDYVDMVISDYSSASSDAIFKKIITLEYCPDFDYYKNDDRGFVNEFMNYHIFEPVFHPDNLFSEIDNKIALDPLKISKYDNVKALLFGEHQMTMEEFAKLVIGLKNK